MEVDTVTPAFTHALPLAPFTAATARVNEWRGRCLDGFTRAEEAVTETLVSLAAVKDRGSTVKLPHLQGQRVDALVTAIGPAGPFEVEGKIVRMTLDRWRDHADFRNMLCHGTCKITLDPQAKWTAVFRLVALKSNRICRDMLALTENEAETLQDEIMRLGRTLSSQLGQLRADLKG